ALEEHGHRVRGLASTADGKALAAVAVEDLPGGKSRLQVKLWDLTTRKEVHGMHAEVERVPLALFAGDGGGVLVPGHDGRLVVWDTRTGQNRPRAPAWQIQQETPGLSAAAKRYAMLAPIPDPPTPAALPPPTLTLTPHRLPH